MTELAFPLRRFVSNFGIDDYCIYNRNFLGEELGYRKCIRLLLTLKPDMLVAAHYGPLPFAEANLRKALELLENAKNFWHAAPVAESQLRARPPLGSRISLPSIGPAGQAVTLEARIFNHSDVSQTLLWPCARLKVGKFVKEDQ